MPLDHILHVFRAFEKPDFEYLNAIQKIELFNPPFTCYLSQKHVKNFANFF